MKRNIAIMLVIFCITTNDIVRFITKWLLLAPIILPIAIVISFLDESLLQEINKNFIDKK